MKKMLAMMMVLCMMLSALCCTAFADDGYQIQVLDQDGYPVQGVAVQFCSDEQCMLGKTDEEGIAVFDMPAGSYTIHLLKVPAGYEKDTKEYAAPETPELVTLTVNQEVKPSQTVAAAGDQAKEAPDESEFVLDAPVVGLHFVTPESLRSLKGNLVWNADFIDTGVLNIPVEYEGEHNIIIPDNAASTPIDGKAQPAVVADSTATAGWTIPAADNYRVTINFNTRTVTVIPTSEIFEVDRIFLAGSATPKDSLEVVPTLEEPSVYAFYDDLKAGELYMTVEYEKATNFAIVPEEGHDIADGAAVAFSQAPVKQVPGNKYWTVPADGKYRIVINTTARTIAICSPATDLPNKTVSYNNTVDKINPYTQEVKDQLWMWGGFNAAEKDPDQAKAGFQAKYTLKQSLANPYVFVYYGDPLPRKSGNYNSKNQETGATSGPAWLTFLVSNIENNVYAYGSTAPAKRNNYTGTVEPALGETSTIVGGQGDNRYAYFVIPVDCNYVEVNIDAMTVVFDKR